MGEDAPHPTPGSDPQGVLMSLNSCLLDWLSPATPVTFFQDGKRSVVPFKAEPWRIRAPGSFSCHPAHQPRSAGCQWSPHSGGQTDHPARGGPGNICDAFCYGVESPEAPKAQRVTVSTGWKGARRPQNGIWILFFKGLRGVAHPTFEFASDTYSVPRCRYSKLRDVFLELQTLALACGLSFTPLRVFTII